MMGVTGFGRRRRRRGRSARRAGGIYGIVRGVLSIQWWCIGYLDAIPV